MNHLIGTGFWQQAFAYLETYSFNRGPATPELHQQLSQQLVATRGALQTARYMPAAKLSRQLHDLETELRGGAVGVYLPAPDAPAQLAAHKIATLAPHDLPARQLAGLLERAAAQEAFAGCPPIYRDALVFCDAQGRRVRVLNICFECLLMETSDGQVVEADFATYEALRTTLLALGHPIETGS